MRALKTALLAMVLGAAATTAAHAIASVTVFGLKAPEEIGGFTLNDSVNYERGKPGEGYGLDYSQPGWKLDVYIYDLKRSAIPPDAKSAIVRAEFERSREDVFSRTATRPLRAGLSAAQLHHRRCQEGDALSVRRLPHDA